MDDKEPYAWLNIFRPEQLQSTLPVSFRPFEDNLCGFKDKSVCRWAFALISMPWKMYRGPRHRQRWKKERWKGYKRRKQRRTTHTKLTMNIKCQWQPQRVTNVETIWQDDSHTAQIWNKSLDGLLTRKQIFAAARAKPKDSEEMSTCSHRPSSACLIFPSALPSHFHLSWPNTSACKATL